MATSPFPFMRLPAEIRIMIYEAVSDDCDLFYMMKYLLHGKSDRRFTRVSSGDRTDVRSAKGILSLLMTTRQIQAEALRVLSGLKLCVAVPKGINRWEAAVVRDTTVNEFPRSYEWPWKTSSGTQELLIQCFSSLTLSVGLGDYVMLTINISSGDQISVDIYLHPHPDRESTYCSKTINYVGLNEMNDAAIAKLKAKTLRRVRAYKRLSRELVQDIVGDLSRVGWHPFPKQRVATSDNSSDHDEYDLLWHISVPGTSAHDEKKLREAEAEMPR